MDLFGKKKIRELEDKVEKQQRELDTLKNIHTYTDQLGWSYGDTHNALRDYIDKKFIEGYSTKTIKDLTIQEFFDFYFDGKPIKRKEEVDVEYRKG